MASLLKNLKKIWSSNSRMFLWGDSKGARCGKGKTLLFQKGPITYITFVALRNPRRSNASSVQSREKRLVCGCEIFLQTTPGCTGQCCPLCPFICFLYGILSSHPVYYHISTYPNEPIFYTQGHSHGRNIKGRTATMGMALITCHPNPTQIPSLCQTAKMLVKQMPPVREL